MTYRSRIFQQLGCALLLLAAGCTSGTPAQPSPSPAPAKPAGVQGAQEVQEVQSDTAAAVHGYPSATPLQSAVDEFNARAQRDSVGKSQPPLTAAEVIAALRALGQSRTTIPGAQKTALQSIVNTSTLPKGAYLRFIPGLVAVDGYDIDVWWIDLQLDLDKYPTDLADQPMHTFRIRMVYVTSRHH